MAIVMPTSPPNMIGRKRPIATCGIRQLANAFARSLQVLSGPLRNCTTCGGGGGGGGGGGEMEVGAIAVVDLGHDELCHPGVPAHEEEGDEEGDQRLAAW